ncbi:MAG TPA: transglycosylase SLT domain-containing protein [Candidatus Gastranaerophilales bacterium]|nr:transglycosylase SLT domain-containing protein [Candidatus Gastranaerophilales bacterium]
MIFNLLLNLWFQPPATNYCDLVSVVCETEQPEYIKNYIKTEFDKAGLDSDRAVKIAELESRFNLDAYNINRNGSNDMGLWQINSIHKLSDDCRTDLKCSTEWAIQKVKIDGNFSAWSVNKLIR